MLSQFLKRTLLLRNWFLIENFKYKTQHKREQFLHRCVCVTVCSVHSMGVSLCMSVWVGEGGCVCVWVCVSVCTGKADKNKLGGRKGPHCCPF